ncbi:MAG: hypothetical protein ACREAE_03630 [Nitrosopumilaceae archaeon]
MTSRITDRALIELLARATNGQWGVASDENIRFYIYKKDSSPLKYVLKLQTNEDISNYDLRLMALARELGEEVIELRRKYNLLKTLKEELQNANQKG